MEYTLSIKPRANKNLEKFPEKDRLRAKTVLSLIRSNPFQGKKLKGEYKGYYSARSWPYRIVYRVIESRQEVIVAEIDHRGNSYRAKFL
ncbi:MAG: type II toxin-antitoxin system RelE/ParE family toxin [Candidatus Yanofskybacteria bacterium]|nr:type II toxin-antitoxin system RelE/ParE family toxin [Candidatus Yanofskybacteria bacterium]